MKGDIPGSHGVTNFLPASGTLVSPPPYDTGDYENNVCEVDGVLKEAPTARKFIHGHVMILMGGKLEEDLATERLFELIAEHVRGVRGKVGVIVAASKDPADGRSYYPKMLSQQGLAAEVFSTHYRHPSSGDDALLAARIREVEFDAILFGGGDQSRYVSTFLRPAENEGYRDSLLLAAIRTEFQKGILTIVGSSAGTVIQNGGFMVTGGEKEARYSRAGGFHLFPYGLLDTHFSERDRSARMRDLLRESDQDRFFGIDEKTALVVHNTGQPDAMMEVRGEGNVIIFDSRYAERDPTKVEGLTLSNGDWYDPDTHAVTPQLERENKLAQMPPRSGPVVASAQATG